ncbi:MAG: nucleotide exchange factor GrpE [bacterium]|nr:nucleotide exchange factor GrpE [bacterium]
MNEDKNFEEQLKVAEQKAEEYLDGWKRAKADYANAEREHQGAMQGLSRMMRTACVRDLAEVLAHWKRAAAHIPEEALKEKWVQGLVQIQRLFEDYLKKQGVEEMKTVGEKFDPARHESVGAQKVEGKESGEIVAEVEPGYTIDGDAIVPARVVISE